MKSFLRPKTILYILQSLKLLGFKLEEKETLYLKEKDNIEKLVKARTIARENKDYNISDKIRNALNYLGYELRDTNSETIYFQKEEKPVKKEEFQKILNDLKREIEEKLKKEELLYLKEIFQLIKEYEYGRD
ncbi:MAG: hypothetical protein ABIK72_06295 [candidate division WOR-3 bacterium]